MLVVVLAFGFLAPTVHAQTKPFIIVNKKSHQLAYVKDGRIQQVYKVATGKTKELTPEGLFTIIVKAVNPYYRKKDIPGGDPRNPLGTRWIGFNARGTDGREYGVHGTNQPWLVGTSVSSGCIRMRNQDIEKLYPLIPIGSKILVINSPKSFQELIKQYQGLQQ
ncbi:L,D-transpeptidase [Peribacillus sp. SCS-26]|uniref:L,D-transpeptidase n=1 Tax=Paraperibacillus marinus TaxID=3115295 RepID=UPI0039063D01